MRSRLVAVVMLVVLPAIAAAQQRGGAWETERYEMNRRHVMWTLEVSWVPTATKEVPVRVRLFRASRPSEKIEIFDGTAAVDPHHGPVVLGDDEQDQIALCGTSKGPAGCACVLQFDTDDEVTLHGCYEDGELDADVLIGVVGIYGFDRELDTWLRKGADSENSTRSATLLLALRDAAQRAVTQGNYKAAKQLLELLPRLDWPSGEGNKLCVGKPTDRESNPQSCASLPTDFPPEAIVELGELMLLNGMAESARDLLRELQGWKPDPALVQRLEQAFKD